jgi:hypothetical protein
MTYAITILLALLAFIVFWAAIWSLPIMLLWDWLMPSLFGLPEITWLQAWGLMFLVGLLFRTRVTVRK